MLFFIWSEYKAMHPGPASDWRDLLLLKTCCLLLCHLMYNRVQAMKRGHNMLYPSQGEGGLSLIGGRGNMADARLSDFG